jgi:hypothetical protein
MRSAHPRLAADLAGFNRVSDVLAWMQRRDLCSAAVDMIGMDEFEYDFLIELHAEGCWLAFGLT